MMRSKVKGLRSNAERQTSNAKTALRRDVWLYVRRVSVHKSPKQYCCHSRRDGVESKNPPCAPVGDFLAGKNVVLHPMYKTGGARRGGSETRPYKPAGVWAALSRASSPDLQRSIREPQ